MGFLPLKCQCTINRLKVDMPVWTVCLWIPWSPKQKQMRLIKWFSVTLLLVNNWYPGTAPGERRHKVLNLSTSIMGPFSFLPTSSWGSGSAMTCCSVSVLVTQLSWGHRGWSCCSSSRGGGYACSHFVLSCFGATWAKTGLTLATIAAERGLAVRPRWTVSQPSASFLPGEHMRYCVNPGREDATVLFKEAHFLQVHSGSVGSLTMFFYRGGGGLTGAGDGLSALHSVCPAGTCVGEPGCSQCSWRTTE